MPAVDAGIAQKAMTYAMAFFLSAARFRIRRSPGIAPNGLGVSRNFRMAREDVVDLLFVA